MEEDVLARAPLVGSQHHALVTELHDLYDAVRRTWRPRMVSITGETGIGKTRAVHELYARLADGDAYWAPALVAENQRKAVAATLVAQPGEPRWFWLGIACYPDPTGAPAPALVEALRRQIVVHALPLILAARRRNAQRAVLVKGARAVGSLLGADAIAHVLEVLGRYEEIRDLAHEARDAAAPKPAHTTTRAPIDGALVEEFFGVVELIDAAGWPMVVALEDAHAADPTTLDALGRLLHTNCAALVVATAWRSAIVGQQERGSGFGGLLAHPFHRPLIAERHLDALPRGDLAALAAQAAAARQTTPIDGAAVDAVVERAGGNPYLLSQLLGIARANGLALTASAVDDLTHLPDSRDEIFLGVWRDVLTPGIRHLLLAAAIVGAPLLDDILVEAGQALPEPAVGPDDLDGALRRGWLASLDDPYSGHREVRFAEPFFRSAAERFATGYIDTVRQEVIAAAVFAATELDDDVSSWSRRRALEKAVELISAGPGEALHFAFRTAALRQLGEHLWGADVPRAAELLTAAAETMLTEPGPVEPELVDAAANALVNAARLDDARALLDRAGPGFLLSRARIEDEDFGAKQRFALAAVRAERRQPGTLLRTSTLNTDNLVLDALQELARATVLAQDRDLRAVAAQELAGAMTAAARGGRWAESVAVWQIGDEAELLAREDLDALIELGLPDEFVPPAIGDGQLSDEPTAELAERLLDAGDYEEAASRISGVGFHDELVTLLPAARRLAAEGGPLYADVHGRIAIELGMAAEAVAPLRRALRLAEQLLPLDARDVQGLRCDLAYALALSGAAERARELATTAVEVAESIGEPGAVAQAVGMLGVARAAQGAALEAESHLRRAYELAKTRTISIPSSLPPRIAADLCELYARRDDWYRVQDVAEEMHARNLVGGFRAQRRLIVWAAEAAYRLDPDAFVDKQLRVAGLDRLADDVVAEAGRWLRSALDGLLERMLEDPAFGATSFAIDGPLRERVATALVDKGVTLAELGRAADEIAVYEEVLARFAETTEPPVREEVVRALVYKAITLRQLGRATEVVQLYDAVHERLGDVTRPRLRVQVAWLLVRIARELQGLGRGEDAAAVFDDLAEHFGDVTMTGIREQVAKALVKRGIRLAGLRRWQESLVAYDEVVARFGDATESVLQKQVATALTYKGFRLGGLGRWEEATAAYDEVLTRYGEATDPALRVQVAMAQVNKGFRLARLGRSEEAVAVYDEVIVGLADMSEPAARGHVARALVNKAGALRDLDRREEALTVCGMVIAGFGDLSEPGAREQVSRALVNKAETLAELDRFEEAIAAYDETLARYGGATELGVREQVATALVQKAATLQQLGCPEDAEAAFGEVLTRFGDTAEPSLSGSLRIARRALWKPSSE